jgi:hypothetical protein
MQRLKFHEFIDSYSQYGDLLGEIPREIRMNAMSAEVGSWREFEQRLRASGADDDVCRTGKRIWRRYRVAARSTLF